jgi:hypothetical protein
MLITDIMGNGLGPTGSFITLSAESFVTDLIDLTTTPIGIETIPARPGHIPIIIIATWIIELVAGTQVTAATMQSGSNAAHNNFTASGQGPTNADVNGANPPSIGDGSSPLFVPIPSTLPQIPNAPVYLDVTAPAQGTGGFALKARALITVTWMPVGTN